MRAMTRRAVAACLGWVAISTLCACTLRPVTADVPAAGPYLIVLGIAQDGGVPQAGSMGAPGWSDPTRRRMVVCLGLVDPESGRRWMFEATPDFPDQLARLHEAPPRAERATPDGIFLTHAHIGHYSGLMFLGHESMGARAVPVHAMPRMAAFLASGGPWDRLVLRGNIEVRALEAGVPVDLRVGVRVTPFVVPHRQEYSEVVGYRIDGPSRSALFIPDIDSWREWDEQGTRLEDQLAGVDVAYLDGTFYADGEIPGRDMSGFPHPFITHTMDRLGALPPAERAKVRFIHLNHTNPALWSGSGARRVVERNGYRVAEEGERFGL